MYMKIVITGTTQGLGAQLSRVLSGSELIVINRRASGTTHEIIGDLSSEADVKRISNKLEGMTADTQELSFILNAAMYGEDETISDVTPDAVGELLYVNVFSQLSLVEYLITRGMTIKLVAISSQMGSIGMSPEPYHYAYSVSKAALNLAVRLLSKQYKGKLDYLIINPGWMPTQMGGDEAPDDPAMVARRIVEAMRGKGNWNNSQGMLEVNTGAVNPW